MKEILFGDQKRSICKYNYRKDEVEQVGKDGEKIVNYYKKGKLITSNIYINDSITFERKYVYDNKGFLKEIIYGTGSKFVLTYDHQYEHVLWVKGSVFIPNSEATYEEDSSIAATCMLRGYNKKGLISYDSWYGDYYYEYDKKGNYIKIKTKYPVIRDITYY